jgi:hypothetical protein
VRCALRLVWCRAGLAISLSLLLARRDAIALAKNEGVLDVKAGGRGRHFVRLAADWDEVALASRSYHVGYGCGCRYGYMRSECLSVCVCVLLVVTQWRVRCTASDSLLIVYVLYVVCRIGDVFVPRGKFLPVLHIACGVNGVWLP